MVRKRRLNSDKLGHKGEARFREICHDAELVCNKSEYDRTGWDFLVEFPFQRPEETKTYDGRPAPLSCYVQVKTTWDDNESFSVKLSAAEYLAKNPKPTFFFVLRVNDKLEPSGAFLIPIMSDVLGRILSRLRLSSQDKSRRLNKSTITFNVSEGRAITASGDCLRAALNDACAPDLATTMRKKLDQIHNLGFEADAYSGNTTFQLQPGDELADVFLGLKKVKLQQFEVFETRFGIKLPHTSSSGDGLLHIQPNRADVCRVIVRAGSVVEPASFDADIFIPSAKLDSANLKFLLRAPLFEIQITKRGMQLNTLADQFNGGSFIDGLLRRVD